MEEGDEEAKNLSFTERLRIQLFYMIENGKVYSHSTAGLRIARLLPWYLKWLYIFIVIPKPIRDWMYSLIAKNRYKIWGKRNECMVPDEKVKNKFILKDYKIISLYNYSYI